MILVATDKKNQEETKNKKSEVEQKSIIEEKKEELEAYDRKENAKQATLFTIIVILIVLLLLFIFGYYLYGNNFKDEEGIETVPSTKENVDKDIPQKDNDVDINENTVATTRLVNVMGILNNPFIENTTDKYGYIYRNGHNDLNSISNDYIIYTALNYLSKRNELENNDDAIYNKKVRADLVDKTIKNVFGSVSYNKEAYRGNTNTCPMGYYNSSDDYFYVGTICSIGDITIETYNYRIIEKPSVIEIYQAKAYVKDTPDEHIVYRDETLVDVVSEDPNYEINISNYEIFKKYKFTFTKGEDGLFHFDSIDIVG